MPGAVLAFLAAVLLFAVAALPGRDHVLRVVALAAGAVALFEATTVAFDGNAETAALLGQGVVLLGSQRRCGRDRCWSSAGSSG